MTAVVLDASALLALLRGETGADMVAAALPDARIGVVNLAEVASHYAGLGMAADELAAMLEPLPLTAVPADAALALEAGRLRRPTMAAGLSLGDRFCLALARRERLPAMTADRGWAGIADAAGVDVRLIR